MATIQPWDKGRISTIHLFITENWGTLGMPRDQIHLACDSCSRHNYTATKNRRTHPSRVEFKKYCRFCRKHTSHREIR